MKFHATRRAAFSAVALAFVGLFAVGGCSREPENLAGQIGPITVPKLYVCRVAPPESDIMTV